MKKPMPMARREAMNGYLYILPWIIGFLVFFISPIVQTVMLAFSEVDKKTLASSFIGAEHFIYAFRGDAEFPRLLWDALKTNLQNAPLILIFSFFVALLLKKDFRGAFLVKSVFFLTVILASDLFIRMQVENNTLDAAQMQGVLSESSSFFQTLTTEELSLKLVEMGIPEGFSTFLTNSIKNISYIMIRSGIQIFIFLAGLNSIPDSMYEAASIEGATGWETFWKITFPISTPIIMVNLVYTVVDSFNSQINGTINYIYDKAFTSFNYGYSAALSLIYFLVIGGTLGLVFVLFRKRVHYQA